MKKPGWGPSVLQPMPSCRPWNTTTTATTARTSPQTMSAVRTRSLSSMVIRVAHVCPRVGRARGASRAAGSAARTRFRLLLQQASLGHQVLVEHLGALQPLDEIRTGLPRGVERALRQVFLELRRLVDLLEHPLVEGDGL